MINLDNPFRMIILLISSIIGVIIVILLARSYARKKINTLFAMITSILFFTLTTFFTIFNQIFNDDIMEYAAYSCHIIGTLAIYFFTHRLFSIYLRRTLISFSILSIGMIIMHFLAIQFVLLIQVPFSFHIYCLTYWHCAQTSKLTNASQKEVLANLVDIQKSVIFIFLATTFIVGAEIINQIIGNAWQIYEVVDTIGWACTPLFAYYTYRAYAPTNLLEKQSSLLKIQDLSAINNDLKRMVNEHLISEKELNNRIVELRTKDHMRSEFFASFSHELRTPLNGIIGFTQLLLDNQIDTITDTQREILNDVNVSGKHLLSIIENVLDISKLETGNFTIVSTEIDLEIMMAEVAQICEFRSRQKQITINFPIISSIKIWGDFQRLKQVLINIIDNAIKYSFNNTIIDVLMTVMNGDIKFKIIDHGIGIPRDKLTILFYPYQRVENYVQRGWGMGLYYSKQIIDLHHGNINIESEVNKGTTITIVIPRSNKN